MAWKHAALVVSLVAASGCRGSGPASAAPPDAGGAVDVQLLTLSTWLGQLDPTPGDADDAGVAPQYGGLAALSSYFAAERAQNPNTALLMAGDSFGASPPLSSQFDDVPAVRALGFLDARVDMLSNHNFNEGIPYLQTLVNQSAYPYVASNMDGVQAQVSANVVTPYVILPIGPVKVGVLGLTDPNAPNKTLPGNFGTITLSEPTAAANAAAKLARAAGAQAIVALTDLETTGVTIAGAPTGPLIDFTSALSGIDVVIGYNQTNPGAPRVGNALVVEHTWKGLTYGRTRLHFEDGVLTSTSADVVLPDVSAVTPDPAAVALLAPYRTELAQLLDGKIATTSGSLLLDGTERVQETALGDLVASAFLAKYAAAGAQIAITNGAALRDALPSSYAPNDMTLRRPMTGYASGPPYDLVVGDVYSVLPFDDLLVLRPVTGAVLWQALEQSVFQEPSSNNGFLQIAGFKFTYQLSAPVGARVQSVTLDDGTVVTREDAATYMLVDTTYLDSGGDDYGMLVQTPAAVARDVEDQALLDYLRANPQVSPTLAGRITQVP